MTSHRDREAPGWQDREDFLAAPMEELRPLVPPTVLWAVEGTRRAAALAGIEPLSEDYPCWSIFRMCDSAEVFFHHGVKHVFHGMLTPSQFAEVTPRYRERLFAWVAMMVDDARIRRRIQAGGWRLRLLGGSRLPELWPIAQRMIEATPTGEHTLWCSVVADTGSPWDDIFHALAQGARTREEAIRALYGEDIAPAALLVAFGKPVISPDQFPPLLLGKTHCYWTQKPGYCLDQKEFRTILHDYAVVRSTWRQDKTGRAEEATAHRRAWEEGPVLGLGIRLGPFWYPAPLSAPPEDLP